MYVCMYVNLYCAVLHPVGVLKAHTYKGCHSPVNRNVFNCFLKDFRESHFLMDTGMSFHRVGPAYEKERCPNFLNFIVGVFKSPWDEDRRTLGGMYGVKSSHRYDGAHSLKHLYTMHRILKSILKLTGSQWRSLSTGDMCARGGESLMILAHTFWINCSLCTCSLVIPKKRLLQ